MRLILERGNIARAMGLAESLEHPVGVELSNGTRAVASEIVVLLRSALQEVAPEWAQRQEGQ